MTTLIFENKGLQSLLQIALQAKSFRATFAEASRAYEQDTGLKYQFGKGIDLVTYQQMDTPNLWLAKDRGIYLMTSAKLDTIPADQSHICYAVGFSPNDTGWYDKCKNTVGGDDLVESFPFDEVIQKGIRDGADIYIDFEIDSLTIKLAY
ncbi:MAG: DUF3085 domain-containing protein [Sphingobacteriales bacterium]|nr:DUF3085 domain-containing protein [Sphingobacteriales bacterium]OJW00237.1 MAG: hypothetical protein BGO52_03890 [Sphingobacteriales bacterium 44-61]